MVVEITEIYYLYCNDRSTDSMIELRNLGKAHFLHNDFC